MKLIVGSDHDFRDVVLIIQFDLNGVGKRTTLPAINLFQ